MVWDPEWRKGRGENERIQWNGHFIYRRDILVCTTIFHRNLTQFTLVVEF